MTLYQKYLSYKRNSGKESLKLWVSKRIKAKYTKRRDWKQMLTDIRNETWGIYSHQDVAQMLNYLSDQAGVEYAELEKALNVPVIVPKHQLEQMHKRFMGV